MPPYSGTSPFQTPHISHAVAVLILGLELYSEEPDSVVDAINVFLFPDLSPSASSEAALLTRMWYAILGGGALTSFVDTSLLIANQRLDSVTRWEAEAPSPHLWTQTS